MKDRVGDAVLAVFGALSTHNDDPIRAVHAALRMRERIGRVDDRLGLQVGHPLRLHIGVSTGLVVFGPTVRAGARPSGADVGVVGDAVNLGARLQHAAGPDQIFVAESTYAATRHVFEYRRLAPLRVRGKQTPVVAYE